jgi:glycosyltransferase involved in cell wall biosynthesis
VKANVFVGRQQYDRYIDHKIIKKSTYIYNMYPEINDSGRKRMDTHIVTYIGSLVPQKGFHVLANAWKSILEKVPDAELYVIGSGKLYSRNATLGKYSIAEQTYEELFMDGLTDKDGMVLPSVHFLGVMGSEKKEIILKTAVGVPNPTGRTETFGISALDFEALGTPVVTIAKGGFLDTVIDKRTGRLYHSTNELAMMIVELLTNKQLNEEYGRNGIYLAKEFAPEKIICQWDKIFKKVMTGESMEYIEPNSFLNNNLKLFRIINRKIKNTISLEYPISVIGIESVARKVFRLLEKCRG